MRSIRSRVGYKRTMRRFLSDLAVYFGLKDDDSPAPPPQPVTPRIVVAIVVAGLVVAVLLDAFRALVGSSRLDLADLLWHAASFSVALLILRVVQNRVLSGPDDGRRQGGPSADS